MKQLLTILFLLFAGTAFSQTLIFGMKTGTPAKDTILMVGAGSTSTNANTPTPGMPAGIASGMLLVMNVQYKPASAVPPAITGWTASPIYTGGAGTEINDAGQTGVITYYKVATGPETGTRSVAVSGANIARAQIYAYQNGTGLWNVAITGGADNTPGTGWSVTFPQTDLKTGDVVLVNSSMNTDLYNYASFSLTAAGITTGTAEELFTGGSNVGNDLYGLTTEHMVTGNATGPATFTATASGSTTNAPAGAAILIRLRQL